MLVMIFLKQVIEIDVDEVKYLLGKWRYPIIDV